MTAAPRRMLEEEVVAVVVVGTSWKADTAALHPRRMMQAVAVVNIRAIVKKKRMTTLFFGFPLFHLSSRRR